MALIFDGLTLIPPEILETCRKNCRIEQLTLGCLRKQLKIPSAYPIVVNGVVQRDMDFVLDQGDRIQVLPTIAGG